MQDGPAAVRLDPTNACLWRGAEARRLTPQAWAVLAVLVGQAGQLVTKATLLETAWPETVVSEAALVVCIREIRQALGDTARTPQYLETVHRRGYRFIGPLAPPAASPAAAPLAALGREAELRVLHGWLAQAQGGARCVGFVLGEVGIGKTTLVDAFVAQAATGTLWLGRGQCIAHYGAGEAYLPVLEALGELCQGPEAARILAVLAQQAPLWLLQLPAVLRAPARETLQRQVQGATPERMLREFAEAVEALTAERPLVLVLEDLHWSDVATLDLVGYLARRRAPARLLLLGTYRPVDVIVHGHPLQALKLDLALHGQCVEVLLEGLSAAAVAAVVAARLPGPALPPAVVAALYRRTDGHPLFLVQVVEALRRQGVLVEEAGRWVLPGGLAALEATVPESLRQLIEQQFDGLSAEVQQGLEAASVAGVDWAVAAVAAGVDADMEQVEGWCAALARQGQFVQAGALVEWPDETVGGSYQFRHALYQQVVYDRITVGRRVRLHQRIGLRVEAGYGARTHEVAAELAGHFERGHDPARAVRYRQQAAANALQRYAYREAIAQLTTASELLATLPDTPERARQELEVQLALGAAWFAVKGQGAPEVAQAYQRARALCQHVADTPQLGPVLVALRMWYYARAELRIAHALSEDLLHLAQHAQEPALMLEAHRSVGITWFGQGAFAAARRHLEQGIALSAAPPDTGLHHQAAPWATPGVSCRMYAACVLWGLGYADQALQQGQEALTQAQTLAHPVSEAVVRHMLGMLHVFRGDGPAAQQQAEASLRLATHHDLAERAAQAVILRGGALVLQGHAAEGMAQLTQGLAATRAIGGVLFLPYYLSLLAVAYGYLGQPHEGLRVLAEALALAEQTGECWWQAELYRLQGDLLLQQGSTGPHQPAEAAACLQQALDTARRQQARALELRAALSLARLWQRQGQRDAARALLAPLYGWFTEGFDTADLQEARTLLEALGA